MSLNSYLGSLNWYHVFFLHPRVNKYQLNKFYIMRLVASLIEEEGYEEHSCSSAGRFIKDDVDDLCPIDYDEFI